MTLDSDYGERVMSATHFTYHKNLGENSISAAIVHLNIYLAHAMLTAETALVCFGFLFAIIAY